MYSLHYYPCGQLSSYFSVYSIVVLMDSSIALPRIAQLQVALEEKHHRRLMDFCRRKYYGNGGASCMHKIFTKMDRILLCTVVWMLYAYYKLFTFVCT